MIWFSSFLAAATSAISITKIQCRNTTDNHYVQVYTGQLKIKKLIKIISTFYRTHHRHQLCRHHQHRRCAVAPKFYNYICIFMLLQLINVRRMRWQQFKQVLAIIIKILSPSLPLSPFLLFRDSGACKFRRCRKFFLLHKIVMRNRFCNTLLHCRDCIAMTLVPKTITPTTKTSNECDDHIVCWQSTADRLEKLKHHFSFVEMGKCSHT